MQPSPIDLKLLSSRKELLDISLRNSMINFRMRLTSLNFVDCQAEDILQVLYRQAKALVVLPQAEPSKPTELSADLSQPKLALHPNNLQTNLEQPQLFERLLRIQTTAKDFIEAQGVNILFLALGFLDWLEADTTDTYRKAPLLLLPVQLKRSQTTQQRFSLEYTGDELGDNLSLAAKLKADFGINLPSYVLDGSVEAEEMPPLADFFAQIEQAIAQQPRWRIHPNEICLGFFSFGKYLMFKDLDPGMWSSERQPAEHPVLKRLLGETVEHDPPPLSTDSQLDSIIAPGELYCVADADSSQTRALIEVRAGRNLVIQGPPGTGKSQTITNIIADCLSQSKTVLFVAEKMAALEVVKRRLDVAHLGDAVLELHSHKANKLVMIRELGRTLSQGKPIVQASQTSLQSLGQLRNQLNEYCAAVNQPIGASEQSFSMAFGRYLQLKRQWPDLQRWQLGSLAAWTPNDYQQRRRLVAEMTQHLEAMGCPRHHEFWGTNRRYFSPLDHDQAQQLLYHVASDLQQLQSVAEQMTMMLGVGLPMTLTDLTSVRQLAHYLLNAPKLEGLKLADPTWHDQPDQIRQFLQAGQRMSQIRLQYSQIVLDHAWDASLQPLRQTIAHYATKWWRNLARPYRQACSTLQQFSQQPLPKQPDQLLTLVDTVLEYQHLNQIYQPYYAQSVELFGPYWQPSSVDWQYLAWLSEWVIDLHQRIRRGELPSQLIRYLINNPSQTELQTAISSLEHGIPQLEQHTNELLDLLGLQQIQSYNQLLANSLSQLSQQVSNWQSSLPTFYSIARFNQLAAELAAAGLNEVVKQAEDWQRSSAEFSIAFDWTYYSGLVNLAYAERSQLHHFDRIKHDQTVTRFAEADQAWLFQTQQQLAKSLWERLPVNHQAGEMDVIRREINKKRRHLPIRQLLKQAGRAIQRIKPVFMMSPISIASFLPQGLLDFDVVIFDEASQIKVVDAFGAILRGKQIIVVGDSQQMPPTDFFSREVIMEEEDNTTGDLESILALFRARGIQECFLNWHYRSRHDSLINVSNKQFYEQRLVIFPSPGINPDATGLSFRYVPDTYYDRGGSRANVEEARSVAQAVLIHAQAKPLLSLGVVAFSMAQREQIQLELEQLRRQSPQLEAFITSQHPTEPFFIKNLENVQGDERDVILISIGYGGRNSSGRLLKEFGPINRRGGERRLNVLITRAKLAMAVFCSFRADEIDLGQSASHGLHAMKEFLAYAEHGQTQQSPMRPAINDTPFEHEVCLALTQRGYHADLHVGSAGYFIDLAIRAPNNPDCYSLALETDGAHYNSADSARDRDRLRQQVLEGLGWRCYRLWSIDWFRDPDQALERIIAMIEASRTTMQPLIEPPPALASELLPIMERVAVAERKIDTAVAVYCKAELGPIIGAMPELHLIEPLRLAYTIKAVVLTETPVHKENVVRRLLERHGLKQAGNRILGNIERAITVGVSQGLFVYADEFLYKDAQRLAIVRNRAGLEASERKFELIAPEEIDSALLEAVRLGFSLTIDLAIEQAVRLLGFGRVTKRMRERILPRIEQLLAHRQLEHQADDRLTNSSL